MLKLSIFLLCYNEELVLPQTLSFYKERFPSASIYLFDNQSTDNSRALAENEGCHIIPFDTKNQQDEFFMKNVRSHMWKPFVSEGSWVIVCDMDEWLDAFLHDLEEEDAKGKTILTTQGIDMVGESECTDLKDILLKDLEKGIYTHQYSKKVCFKYPDIDIEYWFGAHSCQLRGNIQYSEKVYFMRHYNLLGEEYLVQKYKKRFERNAVSRTHGINYHYLEDAEEIRRMYQSKLAQAVVIGRPISLN